MVDMEKPSWKQNLRSRVKRVIWRDVCAYAGILTIYVGALLIMIILPIKLIPQQGLGKSGGDPNVASNNNYLPNTCILYTVLANGNGLPLSEGPLRLPFQRPSAECRTFSSQPMEKLIANITSRMVDKDLARLFENAYPNTLDTTVSWYSLDPSNPLAYVITGDLAAHWLRDASHQFVPYLPLLPYDADLRTLFRGLINLQARHIMDRPYCNAFQPPPESNLPLQKTASGVKVKPNADASVYQCKWEIDSLASFLRLSWGYWDATNGDMLMINDNWLKAVEQIMTVLQQQSQPTIAADGSINSQSYSYQPTGSRATDQLLLGGYGSPSAANGLVRSAFRPSDDSTIFQLLIPANAQLSVNLHRLSTILNKTSNLSTLSGQAETMSQTIHTAIMEHAIVNSTDGQLYAYEIDGFGGVNFMDDANVPSLMSLPYIGFVNSTDAIYNNTRKAILSPKNPYWFRSTSTNYSGIGGPHRGLNRVWPMNWIVQLSTSTSVDERTNLLNLLKTTTAGKGLIHENFDVGQANGRGFGRLWFGWGNSLFGEVLLNMAMEEGALGAELLFGKGASPIKIMDIVG